MYLTKANTCFNSQNYIEAVYNYFSSIEQVKNLDYTKIIIFNIELSKFRYLDKIGIIYKFEDSKYLDDYQYYKLLTFNKLLVNWKSCKVRSDIISIIIPMYNQLELTKKCISSIYATKNNNNFEVVLVDNGSEFAIREAINEYIMKLPNIKLITNLENYNFALGCNIGFSHCSGEIVVFLNNDTVVTDGWMDNLIRPLQNPEIRVVQPLLIYPDNTIQCAGIVFSKYSYLGYSIYQGINRQDANFYTSRKIQAVTGACLAIRAYDFAALHGFDPVFINGQEDIDLCLRLTTMFGGCCFITVDSIVYHYEGKSSGRNKNITENRRTFIQRWKNKIVSDDLEHYKRDKFKVESWIVDSEIHRLSGTEVYKPILSKIKGIK